MELGQKPCLAPFWPRMELIQLGLQLNTNTKMKLNSATLCMTPRPMVEGGSVQL